tara:strand:+ start:28502 stop:30544 length:2043 start_codon:yes stop_codon:yes gene_type:complete
MKKRRNKLINTAFLTGLIGIAAPLFAEEFNDELAEMSLEGLLNLTVTVASKKEESLADAPGIVTVYSQEDMEKTGYYTLAELASITAGYSTVDGGGNTRFETRGQTDGLNAKHLLMIDGIPVNHARDYMAFTQEQLPLQFAEKVEFLRGPASALYGVSAFFGVVNIRSKDLQENGSISDFRVSTGSRDGEKQVMMNTINRSDSGQSKLAFGFYQKDSSKSFIPNSTPLRSELQDRQDSAFGNANYRIDEGIAKGLSMGMIYMSKDTGFGESWTGGVDTSEVNEERREIFIPYLKYARDLTDDVSVNGYLKYNRSVEFGTQTNEIWGAPFFFQYKAVTKNVEYLAETSWRISDDSSLIVGANYDVRFQDDGDSFLFNADPAAINQGDSPFFDGKAKTTSLYTQYSHRFNNILSGLLLTAGGRYDEGQIVENEYSQFSPRVGLVQKINETTNIKLLWGNALKAPGVKEVGQNSEKSSALININDVPNVDPESIETFEISLAYSTNRISASLTYFDNSTDDQIGESALDPSKYVGSGDQPGFFSNNAGKTTSNGFELDLRAAPINNLWLFGNVSITDTEDPNGNALINAPKTKINIGANYNYKQLSSTLIARYVDEYSSSTGVDELKGQTVVDMNFRYPLNEVLAAEFRVTNVLDDNYYQANNGFDGLPKAGRELLFSISGAF